MNPSTKRLAIHEAGHSVFAHHLGYTINHVTINSEERNGETSIQITAPTPYTDWEISRQMEYAISGFVAECLHVDPKTELSPNLSDYRQIKELCGNNEIPDSELLKVFGRISQGVKELLSRPDKIKATVELSNKLVTQGHLSGQEATNILEKYTKAGMTRKF